MWEAAFKRHQELYDLGDDAADASAGEADHTGGAGGEVESTRPRMNGPRSLIVTTTLRPAWVTLSLVPNGRGGEPRSWRSG